MNVYLIMHTTKVRDEVIDDISNVLKDCFGNPSSTHSLEDQLSHILRHQESQLQKL